MVSSIAYATVADLKAQPGITGSGDDTVLTTLILAASRAVDGFCNRTENGFVAEDTASIRVYSGKGASWIYVDEMAVVPTLVRMKGSVDATSYNITLTSYNPFCGSPTEPNWNKTPFTGIMLSQLSSYKVFTDGILRDGKGSDEKPYSVTTLNAATTVKETLSIPTVEVTSRWGYSITVPPLVSQATITLASRWFKRGQSFWSDVIASADFQQMRYQNVVDPDVKMMLKMGRLIRPTYG